MQKPVDTLQALESISRHCPEAIHCYLQCINRCDDDGTVVFTKKQVEEDMSLSWTIFKNNIKKLALEDVLEWHPQGKTKISITLAPCDEEYGYDQLVVDDE